MDRDFIRKDLQQYLSFQKWVIKNYLHGCSSCKSPTRTFTQTHKILAIEKTDF